MHMARLLFSLDLEDHTNRYDASSRYVANTQIWLDYLAQHQLKGTFFVVGRVAEHAPEFVRRIAESGHEIACHSYDHTPITRQSPDQFRDHTKRAKDILEQTIGKKMQGYRAPVFSLTAKTSWAPAILAELGFDYSSSILPSRNPLHGYPGLPREPFLWKEGLMELPAPLMRIACMDVPFLGGFYLRYLPQFIISNALKKLADGSIGWTYVHPYDIDAKEPDWRIHGASAWVSLLLRMNRRNTLKKFDALLPYLTSVTMAQQTAILKPFAKRYP